MCKHTVLCQFQQLYKDNIIKCLVVEDSLLTNTSQIKFACARPWINGTVGIATMQDLAMQNQLMPELNDFIAAESTGLALTGLALTVREVLSVDVLVIDISEDCLLTISLMV